MMTQQSSDTELTPRSRARSVMVRTSISLDPPIVLISMCRNKWATDCDRLLPYLHLEWHSMPTMPREYSAAFGSR
eukprot:5536083-Amphidinium_carterae.1